MTTYPRKFLLASIIRPSGFLEGPYGRVRGERHAVPEIRIVLRSESLVSVFARLRKSSCLCLSTLSTSSAGPALDLWVSGSLHEALPYLVGRVTDYQPLPQRFVYGVVGSLSKQASLRLIFTQSLYCMGRGAYVGLRRLPGMFLS